MEGALCIIKNWKKISAAPLERGLQVFGGKWKSRILCVLNETGTLRYGELKKEMVNVTDAVLADSLKELTADGMIVRKSYDVIPPRVEYSLSDRGRTVIPILQSICRWSGQFRKGKTDHVMRQCEKCDYRFPQ
ncbi:MAG TPA: helix-turn-helix transcriptional regulator [Veillonellaceae bacterium]|nr:helix-turn-helix transcriptional regulator [Veillonellaceae bacterium]